MSWLQAARNRYLVTADPLRTQRRIELVALVTALALCLQLAYGGVRLATRGAPEVVEPAADTMRVMAVLTAATVAENERDEILARPLFWSGRRPVVTVAAAQDAHPRETDTGDLRDVKQVGVFGSGEQAGIIALVNGQKRRILLGETVGEWTLESIGATESEFVNGARRETLTLQRGTVTAVQHKSEKTKGTSGHAGKKARAEASRSAGAADGGVAVPAPVRDTDDSLSLGGGGSGR